MEKLSRRYLAPLAAVAAMVGSSCDKEPAKDVIPAVQTDTHRSLEEIEAESRDQVPTFGEYARSDDKQAAAVVSEQRQREEQEYEARKAADLKANPPSESSDGPRCLIPGAPGGFCEAESGRHFTMEL